MGSAQLRDPCGKGVDQTFGYFTAASSSAIDSCVGGSGQSPSVSSLTFDSTTSTALQ
jgi:hypothetical protein